jgi:hypothetical protein
MNLINKTHIGKRVLLTDGYTGVSLKEAIVLELAPSGDYVKLRHQSGTETWCKNNGWEYSVLEVLENNTTLTFINTTLT